MESISLFQKQDVILHTPSLLQKLQLDKRQFVRVRQGLIDTGFLTIRHDKQQRVFYTLLLNNEPVAVAPSDEVTNHNTAVNDVTAVNHVEEATTSPYAFFDVFTKPMNAEQITADRTAQVIAAGNTMDSNLSASCTAKKSTTSGPLSYNDYKEHIEDFCQLYKAAVYINDLQSALLDWAEMRLKNGWKLTSWGLAILLENLQEIGAGSIDTMTATVLKSIRKRWKGFFSYHADAKPSGIKLCKQEEKQNRAQSNRDYVYNHQPRKPWQKSAPEGRDLSFLEK